MSPHTHLARVLYFKQNRIESKGTHAVLQGEENVPALVPCLIIATQKILQEMNEKMTVHAMRA